MSRLDASRALLRRALVAMSCAKVMRGSCRLCKPTSEDLALFAAAKSHGASCSREQYLQHMSPVISPAALRTRRRSPSAVAAPQQRPSRMTAVVASTMTMRFSL